MSTVRHVTRIDAEAAEPHVPPIDRANVLSDGWSERMWQGFARDGQLQVGVWRGQPGRLRISDQAYDEISAIRSGAVALIDAERGRAEFGPGDTFVVERGFTGVWETVEPTETLYVIVKAA